MIEITEEAKTAKCPTCGSKYLVATGYCLKCKKKVAEPVGKKKESIEILEDVRLPGTNIVLEKGDQIQILGSEE